MQIKTDFPRKIRMIENAWIPMPDGVRLAARIWLPEDAERNPVPAILEYIPYRKDDSYTRSDANRHPYFAGHGYAAVRVDMRGSGQSDGVYYDEYLPQEQLDAVEVIAWLARQPWCTGAVGMTGISWGGFNSLQVAARRPPALKCIITLMSTDDRYHDDIHYMGGCLLAETAMPWAATMLAYNAIPPHPQLAGDNWREKWFERLENTPPFVEAWVTHQRRDEFWKQGSVCENYEAIQCAVYAIGGWVDGYKNAIPRLLEGLRCPRKGLIGPWGHAHPEQALPAPQIGFLQDSLRWYDHWLKGIDTGMMKEPMLRVWMMDSVPPSIEHVAWPGRWVAEPAWPPPGSQTQEYTIGARALEPRSEGDTRSAEGGARQVMSPQHVGIESGSWSPYGLAGEFPTDQRSEDGGSLCFDSAPLTEAVEILGYPEVTLTIAADKPVALVAVRLCDIQPDGASALVSRALLNLTHRESHEFPTPLEPGKPYTVTLRLNAMAYSMPAGHRWRVAVSSSYWPHAWPSPEKVTLTVSTGGDSRLTLPVRPPKAEDAQLPPFEPAEIAPPLPAETLRSRTRRRATRQDVINGRYVVTDPMDHGAYRFLDNGVLFERTSLTAFEIDDSDPLSAAIESTWTVRVGRGDWRARVETYSKMTADLTHFHLTNMVDTYEGTTRVFTKTFHLSIPRDLV